jgi:hypothetical protein
MRLRKAYPENPRTLVLGSVNCWSCDGAKGSGDKCDWRHNKEYCDVVEPTVDAIHKAYWDYQVKELKKQG